MVPVSGQDGDPANLNNVALGTQYVDVWKDATSSARPPAQPRSSCARTPTWPAVTMPTACRRRPSPRPPAAPPRTSRPRATTSSSRSSCKPQPITPDNLNLVLDAGWITKDELCKGVDAARGAGRLQVAHASPTRSRRRPAPAVPPGRRALSFMLATERAVMAERGRPAPAPAQARHRARTSIRGAPRRRRRSTSRLLGMLVALATILLGFQHVSGGQVPPAANMVTLAVQASVSRDHGDRHGPDHRVAQHRPVGRLDRRLRRDGRTPC